MSNKRKSKTPLWIAFSLLLLVVIAIVIVMGAMFGNYIGSRFEDPIGNDTISGTENSKDESVPESKPDDAVELEQDDIIWNKEGEIDEEQFLFPTDDVMNILLIGADDDSTNGVSRTDTMLLMSYNKKYDRITVCSFLRDLFVQIPDHDDDRLNAAYAYGGIDLLKETFLLNFGITIDHYVIVNFEQFQVIVDKLGGVHVEITAEEAAYMGIGSEAGVYAMDGATALAFVRIRYLDSDFGRTTRQRRLLAAILDEYGRTKLASMIPSLLPYCKTDMSVINIASYTVQMMDAEITQNSVPAEGEYYPAYVTERAVLIPYLDLIHKRLKEELYD